MNRHRNQEARRLDRLSEQAAACFACGIISLVLMLCPAIAFAANSTLDQVMSLLGQRKHGEVRFEETDYYAILDRPVRSSGVLVYEAPDHLEKRTLRPKAESLILDGETLTVKRGHRTMHVDLDSYPQIAPFVDAIRDTLAGNERALGRVFKVGFTGTLGSWKLELVPRDRKVARTVRDVQIVGARDDIRTVEILQADGDRSVMTLESPSQPPAP